MIFNTTRSSGIVQVMTMDDVIGAPRRALKFVSLTVAILMAAATVAGMIYGRPWWIAVATGIVSAWSLLIFTELIKEELRELVRDALAERDQQPEQADAEHSSD